VDGRTGLEQTLHRERGAGARQVLLDLLRRLRGLPRQREERGEGREDAAAADDGGPARPDELEFGDS